MVPFAKLESIALSFPEVTVAPHFEKISFRVKNKIFITYDTKHHKATVKLAKNDQDEFSDMAENIIYAVDNKWGQQGWTIVELDTVSEKLLEKLLIAAYCEVAPKTLAKQIKNDQ